MADLNDFTYTDGVHDVLAAYVNRLLAATLRSEYKNVEVLIADKELTDGDTPIQNLDGDGSSFDVLLPVADTDENHPFLIINGSGGAEVLTVKSNDEVTTYKALAAGDAAFMVPDGAGGYVEVGKFATPDHGSLTGLADDDHTQYLLATGLREWAEQASDPSTPASGKWKLYFKSGGLYLIDDAGTVTGPLMPGAGDMVSKLVSAEVSVSSATTLTLGRMHVISGSSNYTCPMPSASGHAGEFIGARFTNTGITTIQAVDGVATRDYYQGQVAIWMSDGTNWVTVQQVMANRAVSVNPLQIVHSSTPAYLFSATQFNSFVVYQNPRANGDYFEFWVFAHYGSWTVSHAGYTNNNLTKLDWSLNGSNIAGATGVDWYSASKVESVVKTFTVSIPFTGWHKIRATVNGRNASSSDWYYVISEINMYMS